MRLAAGALIVAAFALAALGSAARAKRRARLLEALCASLELLRGEVVTRLTPLPDCAALLSRTGPWECREFYASLGLAMDSLGELEFSRLWEACVSALELGEEAQSALADLGRSLGRYAATEQGAAIDRCLAGSARSPRARGRACAIPPGSSWAWASPPGCCWRSYYTEGGKH